MKTASDSAPFIAPNTPHLPCTRKPPVIELHTRWPSQAIAQVPEPPATRPPPPCRCARYSPPGCAFCWHAAQPLSTVSRIDPMQHPQRPPLLITASGSLGGSAPCPFQHLPRCLLLPSLVARSALHQALPPSTHSAPLLVQGPTLRQQCPFGREPLLRGPHEMLAPPLPQTRRACDTHAPRAAGEARPHHGRNWRSPAEDRASPPAPLHRARAQRIARPPVDRLDCLPPRTAATACFNWRTPSLEPHCPSHFGALHTQQCAWRPAKGHPAWEGGPLANHNRGLETAQQHGVEVQTQGRTRKYRGTQEAERPASARNGAPTHPTPLLGTPNHTTRRGLFRLRIQLLAIV
jgi:hypothetical protein